MKKSTIKILLVYFSLALYLSLLCFVFPIFKIKEYWYAFGLLIALFVFYLILGFHNNKDSNNKYMVIAVATFTSLFQVLIFVFFGFKFGFLTSPYTLGINHFLKIVFPILLIIILSELLRGQSIEKGKSSKLVIIVTLLFFVYLDFIISFGLYDLSNNKEIFKMLSLVIFPSIIKNILFTYICYYYSSISNIVYRLIMEIPIYYLPLFPNINDYMNSIIQIIYPFLLLLYAIYYVKKTSINKEKNNIKDIPVFKKVLSVFMLFILIVFVGLMSGSFKYYLLVVGSDSMAPNIKVGDMVLVEKITDKDVLQVGDVLVYNYSDKVILHRIVSKSSVDGRIYFKTKGDNNNVEDSWSVESESVIGKINFKIPRAGYPTIWLNELFQGGKK